METFETVVDLPSNQVDHSKLNGNSDVSLYIIKVCHEVSQCTKCFSKNRLQCNTNQHLKCMKVINNSDRNLNSFHTHKHKNLVHYPHINILPGENLEVTPHFFVTVFAPFFPLSGEQKVWGHF